MDQLTQRIYVMLDWIRAIAALVLIFFVAAGMAFAVFNIGIVFVENPVNEPIGGFQSIKTIIFFDLMAFVLLLTAQGSIMIIQHKHPEIEQK